MTLILRSFNSDGTHAIIIDHVSIKRKCLSIMPIYIIKKSKEIQLKLIKSENPETWYLRCDDSGQKSVEMYIIFFYYQNLLFIEGSKSHIKIF